MVHQRRAVAAADPRNPLKSYRLFLCVLKGLEALHPVATSRFSLRNLEPPGCPFEDCSSRVDVFCPCRTIMGGVLVKKRGGPDLASWLSRLLISVFPGAVPGYRVWQAVGLITSSWPFTLGGRRFLAEPQFASPWISLRPEISLGRGLAPCRAFQFSCQDAPHPRRYANPH